MGWNSTSTTMGLFEENPLRKICEIILERGKIELKVDKTLLSQDFFILGLFTTQQDIYLVLQDHLEVS